MHPKGPQFSEQMKSALAFLIDLMGGQYSKYE